MSTDSVNFIDEDGMRILLTLLKQVADSGCSTPTNISTKSERRWRRMVHQPPATPLTRSVFLCTWRTHQKDALGASKSRELFRIFQEGHDFLKLFLASSMPACQRVTLLLIRSARGAATFQMTWLYAARRNWRMKKMKITNRNTIGSHVPSMLSHIPFWSSCS